MAFSTVESPESEAGEVVAAEDADSWLTSGFEDVDCEFVFSVPALADPPDCGQSGTGTSRRNRTRIRGRDIMNRTLA
jgi:hypothetical protein